MSRCDQQILVKRRTGRVVVLQCHQPEHSGQRHYDATEQLWWQAGMELPPAEYGTYEAVAAYLSRVTGRPVTRQQVYAWRNSRHVNGFPAGYMSISDLTPDECREQALAQLKSQLVDYVKSQGYSQKHAVVEAERQLKGEAPVLLS